MIQQPKILVVDDDRILCDTLSDFLDSAGYNVTKANDGSAAIKSVEEHTPDLIITDILMPEKEGISTIVEIHKTNPEIKIIAMSGGGYFNRMDILKSANALGADATIEKPFDYDEFLELIRKILSPDQDFSNYSI